jgi:predicted naringenin-chalcone synthase
MRVSDIRPRITAISTAAPDHDIHDAFIGWARAQLTERREQLLFDRMAARSGIEHRYAVLPKTAQGGSPVDRGGFYAVTPLPSTAERMTIYAQAAPDLALRAIAGLEDPKALSRVTHIVVASCTGFVAPGVDQIIAARLGLAPSVERLLVGFMGCYAAVSALRSARHIVRSDPSAQVLVVTVELSSLHLQPVDTIEPLLAMLQFGDGAAAALVSNSGAGLALDMPFATTLPDSAHLIRWDIGNYGFAMHLSGEVPGRIAEALKNPALKNIICGGRDPTTISHWAVHAGGRSILDAVGQALSLPEEKLATSRAVLRDHGNMSSATLMFALASMMADRPDSGVALAFGPGLAAEGFAFGWTL